MAEPSAWSNCANFIFCGCECVAVCGCVWRTKSLMAALQHLPRLNMSLFSVQCSCFTLNQFSFYFTHLVFARERLWCKTCNGRQRPCIRYKDLKRLIDNKLWLTWLFVCYLPCLEHDKRNLCEFLMNARMKDDRVRVGKINSATAIKCHDAPATSLFVYVNFYIFYKAFVVAHDCICYWISAHFECASNVVVVVSMAQPLYCNMNSRAIFHSPSSMRRLLSRSKNLIDDRHRSTIAARVCRLVYADVSMHLRCANHYSHAFAFCFT